MPLEILYRNLDFLYQQLSALNKKVVSIILPCYIGRHKIINQMHRFLCQKYQINIIDMHKFYFDNNLMGFKTIDGDHPFAPFMRQMGRNIINALLDFKIPNKSASNSNNFAILQAQDMIIEGNVQTHHLKNSMYDEIAHKIDSNVKLKFPQKFKGWIPIAIHTWNNIEGKMMSIEDDFCNASINYSCAVLVNKKISLARECCFLNSLSELNYQNSFIVDDDSYILLGDSADYKEKHFLTHCWFKTNEQTKQREHILPIKANHFDFIAILLAKSVDFEAVDFDELENAEIEIMPIYDFSALIPPVVDYKEMIDEYCKTADALKFQAYQNEINRLNAELQKLQNLQNTQKEDLNTKNLELENTIKQLQIKDLNQNILLKDLKIRKLAKELGLSINES